MNLYDLTRPALFRLDPEVAHHASLKAMELVGARRLVGAALRRVLAPAPRPLTAFGLSFTHAIGLAAGYDKDALAFRGLWSLGFSHVEVGTVTPRPQPGNPKPRIFRLPADRGVINRLGFPSRGADFVAARLAGPRPPGLVVGVNIGKNKDTPNEEAAEDYLQLLERFGPLADYLVVNISSPNTVGLRRLQARESLDALLGALMMRRAELQQTVPLLVKLSPDLDDESLDDALGALLDHGVDGVVATNTTVGRDGLRSAAAGEKGGLSGVPLTHRSTDLIREIAKRTEGRLPIVGVGGVFTARDAQEKLDAGATLVQLYTGLIYEGPGVVKRIVGGLR